MTKFILIIKIQICRHKINEIKLLDIFDKEIYLSESNKPTVSFRD